MDRCLPRCLALGQVGELSRVARALSLVPISRPSAQSKGSVVGLHSAQNRIERRRGTIGEPSLRRFGALRQHLVCMAGGSEEAAAARAVAGKQAKAAEAGEPTIFDKIVKKEIPAQVVYEDEKVLAFKDIGPQAPTHVVLIPKDRDGLTQLSKAEERHKEILGHLLYAATIVTKKMNLGNGYRIVINDGPDGCQSVYHLHLHILGGRQMKWPPG